MRGRRGTTIGGVAVALVLAAATPAVAVTPATVDGGASPGATATRLTPPRRTFTVAAVGDFLSEGLVNTQAARWAPPGVRYDYEPLLRPVEPLVRFADLAICHMETPISPPGAKVGGVGKGPYGTNLIAAAWESAADLRRVGFDRCSTASNHAYDLGTTGISTTLQDFDRVGITYNGTARTTSEARVRLLVVQGVKVAHLSYARNSNVGFPADPWRLNRAVTATQVLADVATARRLGAEVVIVSLHVYVEMQTGPTPDDRALVNTITRAAAHPDLVVVHGPHVPQPVERVNGVVTYWSLGNFISGMGVAGRGKYSDPRTLDGLLALVRFTERADHTWAVSPEVYLLCNVTGSRIVYPGISTLRDPTISSVLRAQLQACVTRASKVVGGLR